MPLSRKKGAGDARVRDLGIIVTILALTTVLYFITRVSRSDATNAVRLMTTEDSAKDSPQVYASLVTRGNRLMDNGMYAEAAETYWRALELDGRSPDVRTDYGACLHAVGLPHRALEQFKHVVREHPDHATAHFNLGVVYSQMANEDSARLYWQRFLELDSTGSMSDLPRRYLQELENRTD